MTIYYLYVKKHNKTGLRYLGYTTQNPYIYKGSGVDWESHLRVHGNDVDTEIILETSLRNDIDIFGRYYSDKWHILTSVDDFGNRIWANRMIECGSGRGRPTGFKLSDETKDKISAALTGRTLDRNHITKLRDINIGKTHAELSKEKIRQARIGKKMSEETKIKIAKTSSLSKLGKKRGPYKKH